MQVVRESYDKTRTSVVRRGGNFVAMSEALEGVGHLWIVDFGVFGITLKTSLGGGGAGWFPTLFFFRGSQITLNTFLVCYVIDIDSEAIKKLL